MNPLRSLRKARRRGSAIVEFAVMSPVFFALLGGIMDFSRIFHLSMGLNNAARAGVQYAMFSPLNQNNFPGIQNAAINSQPNIAGMTAEATMVCREDPADQSSTTDGNAVTCATNGTFQRQYLTVETSKSYSLFSTYLLLPGNLTVRGRAIVRVQ